MKISELIKIFEEIKDIDGDIEVKRWDRAFEDYRSIRGTKVVRYTLKSKKPPEVVLM
jgi:hypothetical protein